MFQRLSFKTKLIGLCSFMMVVSILVGGIGYVGLNKVIGQYDEITERTVPKTELAYEMFVNYRRIRITLRTLGLPGISSADADTAIRETLEAIDKYEEANKKYVALGFIPGQKEFYDKLQTSWTEFKAVGAKVIDLYKTGKPEDRAKVIDIFFHECPEKAKVYTVDVNALLKFHKETEDRLVDSAQADGRATTIISLLAIVIGSLAGMGIGFFFATATANKLNQIINRLTGDSQALASSSQQIASASQELSQATTEQAASLEETAASVEEMNSMVSKTTENAKNTSATSSASETKANEGQQVIGQMLTSMTEINQSNDAIMQQINASNQQMAEIVNVINEIGTKTKVINDIVFQTKLLSFNASVEAARAGEHGKGFAVVAEEVGNLAAMSGNAAKEISGMLESSTQKVSTIVTETKEKVERLAAQGKAKVETGSTIARQCAQVFEEIVKNVSGVSVMANEISQAAQEQARGIQEITKAMGQLDQVTQQNSATSQQTAEAAEQVSTQAKSLKSAVEELTVTFRGATAPGAAPVVANVVHMSPRKTPTPTAPKLKSAAGDGTVPSHTHPAFEEV